MKTEFRSHRFFSIQTLGFVLVGLLFFAAPAYSEEIQVNSADPSSAEQGTYDLEVTISGDNFPADSEVDFFVHDPENPNTNDPGGIRVKKVKRQGPKTLKVTIDVAPDAQTEFDFDICVRSRGRTGKGTEMFRVREKTVTGPPPGPWQVAIPAGGNSIWNLTGISSTTTDGYAILEDQGVYGPVRVERNSGRDPDGQPVDYFWFIFRPNISDYGVEFSGVSFVDHDVDGDEQPCCFEFEEFEEDCVERDTPPGCMKCFLNGTHPRSIYDFSLMVGTLGDVEALAIYGEPAMGRLMLDMWDHQDEAGNYHRLQCESQPKVIEIVRTGTDEWTISNFDEDEDGGGHILWCEEYYVDVIPRAGKKPGNARVKTEDRVVMRADTEFPFFFETIWTRK